MAHQEPGWDGAGFTTRAIHAGQDPEATTGSVIVPIYQTSTYAQEDIGAHRGFEYSRTDNPTRSALQTAMAALDGAHGSLAFGSGMAAEATIMALLQPGDHVIASDDLYGGSYRLFDKVFGRYGIVFDFVDASRPPEVERAFTAETRMVWIESPTNPLLKIVDLSAMARLAQGAGALLVVDNTFATPYLQRPVELGADIAVYSATKYLGGHSDLVMGIASVASEELYHRLKFHQNAIGAVPGPMDSWLLLRGLKTLALRMERHERNALGVARYLEGQKGIERVIYPGLAAHPQRELAARQMAGYGGIVTIEVAGGIDGARAFMGALRLFVTAESLGGVESLADHPAIMTHASVPPELREAAGISDGLIRLSVGIEDEPDLLQDLDRGLQALLSTQ
ncbi:MAG TPA: PLP-dependent aspartate aminotransferase family protein [Chloroflexota bacterium]|nr:PLP-dependent aspartate aminotransferase family protein [Chloroflexota bacterium]